MTCNFDDYATETLYWDDKKTFKAYHPDIITYYWSILPGGKIINWDTNQNYTVQNPNNYSYEVFVNKEYYVYWRYHYYAWGWRMITGSTIISKDEVGNCSVIGTPDTPKIISNLSNNVISHGYGYLEIIEYQIFNPGQFSGGYYGRSDYMNITPGNLLKITDGGVINYFPVTSPNSVNVINQPGGKEIIVNGNKFNLLDENSIDLLCTDPIYERCPQGTIECECDGQLCCYAPTDYGWRLVKTISLN